MRHINTRQIDSHVWELQITDGYHAEWTAQFDRGELVIRPRDKNYGKVDGCAPIDGKTESEQIGLCMQLMFNWAQIYPQCNEKLDPRWEVLNKDLIHHVEKSNKDSTIDLWLEGFCVNGQNDQAKFLGKFEASTLTEAVDQWVLEEPDERRDRYLRADKTSFWGRRFFDNEAAARAKFG